MTWIDDDYDTKDSRNFSVTETYFRAMELYKEYLWLREDCNEVSLIAEPISKGMSLTAKEFRKCIDISKLLNEIHRLDTVHEQLKEHRRKELLKANLYNDMSRVLKVGVDYIKTLPLERVKELLRAIDRDRLPYTLWNLVLPTKEEINTEYKLKAKKLHPDLGGSVEAMQELNEWRDTELRELKL